MNRFRAAICSLLQGLIYACAAGVVALPLLVTPSLVFPAHTGKAFAFHLLVQVMVAAWLVLWSLDSRFEPKRTPLFWSVTVFMAVVGLANALGVDPAHSFWGDLARSEGYFLLLHLYGFFLVLAAAVRSARAWDRLLLASVAVSAAVTAKGYFEQVIANAGQNFGHRVESTMGNPAFLAAYLLLHIFLAAYLIAVHPERRLRRSALLAVLLAEIFVLAATGTRGAFLGLGAGLAMTLLAAALLAPRLARWRWPLVTACVAIAVLLGGYVTSYVAQVYAPAAAVAAAPGAGEPVLTAGELMARDDSSTARRLVSGSQRSVEQRLLAWTIALDAAGDRPLLGWGQESFEVVSSRYRIAKVGSTVYWDRVHSVALEWAVAAGGLGLLAFATIFFVAGAVHVSATRNERNWRGPLFLGLLAAHLVSSLVLFDIPSTYMTWMMLFAFTDVVYRIHTSSRPETYSPRTGLGRPAAALVLAAVVLAAGAQTREWMLDSARTMAAAAKVEGGTPIAGVVMLEELLDRQPYSRWEVSRALARASGALTAKPDVERAVVERHVMVAVEHLNRAAAGRPGVSAVHSDIARLLFAAGMYTQSQSHLQQAVRMFPKEGDLHLLLAQAAARLEQNEAALAAARTAFELEPSELMRLSYSVLALASDRHELALQLLEPRHDDAFPGTGIAAASMALPMPDGNAAERAVDDPAERAWRAAFIDYQARRGGIGGANATVNRLIATYPSFADVGPRLREDLARARAYVRAAQRMTADARRD